MFLLFQKTLEILIQDCFADRYLSGPNTFSNAFKVVFKLYSRGYQGLNFDEFAILWKVMASFTTAVYNQGMQILLDFYLQLILQSLPNHLDYQAFSVKKYHSMVVTKL